MPQAAVAGAAHPPETRRKVAFLLAMVRTMVLLAAFGCVAALGDPANSVAVTLAFYGALVGWLLAISVMIRRGRVVLAAWSLSLFFWAVVALVTLVFGGMQGGNAACFAVSVLLVGSVVGPRAALGLAVASSVWCAGVVWLEIHGALPGQLAPYRPVNAWTAITVTLVLTSVLLNNSLSSMAHAARERDEALRRSIHAQKMELVGTMSSGVAHDFNNLLMVVTGAVDELRSLTSGSPQAATLLDELDGAVSRATLLTRHLLAFGKTSPGALAPVDLGNLVRSTGTMLPRLLGAPIRLQVEAPPGLLVNATPGGLEQVVLNLAVNARDAMPQGGELRLRVLAEGDSVLLEAQDTGVGMDDATRARIFEPFFTTKTTGTGLGLATVHQLVGQFHGTIDLRSAPGQGTTFVLRFPRVHQAAPAAAAATPNPAAARQQRRILLVEDDPQVRRTVARLLEADGFDVTAVSDGEEALALLQKTGGCAGVVTDVVMPRMDGETLARRLAQLRPSLPVLLMSGNQVPAPDVLAAPLRAFVEKPVDRAHLCERLNLLLDAPPRA